MSEPLIENTKHMSEKIRTLVYDIRNHSGTIGASKAALELAEYTHALESRIRELEDREKAVEDVLEQLEEFDLRVNQYLPDTNFVAIIYDSDTSEVAKIANVGGVDLVASGATRFAALVALSAKLKEGK